MTGIFLDTVGLVAMWDPMDQWHEAALRAFREVMAAQVRVYSSEFVLAECGNALSRTTYRTRVATFRASLRSANSLLSIPQDRLQTVWREYESAKPGQAGIVDLISFVLMRDYGLGTAFTNDRHFKAAGFITLF